MMDHENFGIALTLLVGIAICTGALLRGWERWLALRGRELELQRVPGESGAGPAGMTARIEIADLKERIRKLEAIAAGVEI